MLTTHFRREALYRRPVTRLAVLTACTLLIACAEEQRSDAEQLSVVPIADWADTVDTLPGTYTRVMKPVEYWDTVLVVPDVREQFLWRIVMTTGARDTLGRRGGGPGEYARVGWGAKVHADSVLVLGVPSTPVPVLSVTTGRGRSISLNKAAESTDDEALVRSITGPRFVAADTLGHVYGEISEAIPATAPGTRPAFMDIYFLDTLPLVRAYVRTGVLDTIARMPSGVTRPPARRDAQGGLIFTMGLGPYGPSNGWATAADGRLLLVDAATYALRIMNRTLSDTAVMMIASAPVRVSQRGWDEYVQQTTRGSIALIEQSMSGVSKQLGIALPSAAAPKYIVPPMPATLPPVNFGGGVRAPYLVAGTAWIPVNRVDPPGPEFWDIVDVSRGERVTTLALPDNHRMVLVTERGAYAVAKDADDLERVLVYRRNSRGQAPTRNP